MAHPLQKYYTRIYKSYDLVNKLFTMGQDRKWRKHLINECLSSNPAEMLDLCCGTGDIAIGLKKQAHENARITGYDLNEQMLEIARKKARENNVPVGFIRGDAAYMPFKDGQFDCITIGFGFRNLTWENPDREQHLREMSRVMKPGARLYILESARPENKIIGFLYTLYLKFVLIPLGGVISGDWNAYRYLAGSSACFYSFPELKTLLWPFQLHLKLSEKFLFGSVNLLIATKQGI